MVRFVHDHLLTILSLVLVAGAVAYTFSVQRQQNEDRRERVSAVNSLACAIEVDARGSLKALVARQADGIAGDDLIARNKTRLALAAAELNPTCAIPEDLR